MQVRGKGKDAFPERRTWKYRMLRKQYLQANPMCEPCKKKGFSRIADEVDHKVALSEGGSLLDVDNLQSICAGCHYFKTLGERRRRLPTEGIRGIDLQGNLI